jgi:hypothetical protein
MMTLHCTLDGKCAGILQPSTQLFFEKLQAQFFSKKLHAQLLAVMNCVTGAERLPNIFFLSVYENLEAVGEHQ